MKRPRKPAKLGPHQYCLRLRVEREPTPAPLAKPHLIYRGHLWRLFRNKWKSQFASAAQLCAPTIPGVISYLPRAHDRYRFGYGLTQDTNHEHRTQ